MAKRKLVVPKRETAPQKGNGKRMEATKLLAHTNACRARCTSTRQPNRANAQTHARHDTKRFTPNLRYKKRRVCNV